MSEIKILCCPFCGGEKVISTYNNFVPALLCGSCGAMMTAPMSFVDTYEDKERELLRKWNTRKPMQEIVERLEENQVEYQKLSDQACLDLPQRCYYSAHAKGIEGAIQIVREVGGMNG